METHNEPNNKSDSNSQDQSSQQPQPEIYKTDALITIAGEVKLSYRSTDDRLSEKKA